MAIICEMHTRQLFKSDFEANAETAYRQHYDRIRELLNDQGRSYLEWSVEDGWPPLCEFLNKPVPHGDFPRGNEAAEFESKALDVDPARFESGRRKALSLGIVLTVLVGVVVALF
ncbi:hypothetical protein CLAFUW4_07565 [Fulvia fulva]|uniref:Uncharacterized protein n=1 Tax=Passalora fulva TaxID=5499 RepID=A0A9Q8UQR7_PASFU|nr:uncharacterized protein CLAFUR5_07695 [Fulvia fulva]KAK4621760.1 hypothetical protein CLAFUR4_07571 [Fulvia fulva]KAK4623517.1 hypothetical protein CLAFUR0_07570 [Fulvia fulva]UJO18957.1 hypothetical protein CLAFUR5_07695 [Fulvia fulva]WPV16187.1 hypothetical protein CLAFUW4_07565 [Fulvia fulva]WPV31730.1 hypothetical protein CLAFUW7_07567 [Fulvia fulva]